MNGFTFSEAVRAALARAREEAGRMRYDYVGTEQILLGLLHDEQNLAVQILLRQNVSLTELRAEIERQATPGADEPTGPDLPYSHRSKRVLEEAMAEARNMDDNHLDTGHLLLGLVRDKRDLGAQVLNALGVSRDSARIVYRELRDAGKDDPGGRAPAPSPIPRATAFQAWRVVEFMARTPRFARVFQSHGIDTTKLIDDLRRAEEE